MALLNLDKVCKNYSGLQVLTDVQLSVEAGERRALIGPNGAGKTTLFHLVSGQIRASSGTINFAGEEISHLAPHQMARRGLARTFQTNNLFLHLTTFENVRLSVQQQLGKSTQWFKPWWAFDEVTERTELVLERAGLATRRDDLATNLSYGEQRQLEMAIAMAGEPKLLLLDEPTAGMSAAETAHAVETVARLPRDLTILIIEHDMDTIFAIADRITVLDHGLVVADGTPDEVRDNPQVRAVYLGQEEEPL